MTYVIIGNGVASIGAIEGIRRHDQKGKIVVIREIHKQVTPGSHGSDKVTPLPGRFDGEPMRKRPSYRNGKPSLKMTDYAWAYPWDGKPEEQTSSGYGH